MHTYVQLRGFGLTVVPHAPFLLRRIGDGGDDRVAIDHGDRRVVLDPHRPLAEQDFSGMADVAAEPGDDAWTREFARLRMPWPNHFGVASSELDGVPFELWGDEGAGVFLQGPFDPPPALDEVVAPGQEVAGRGESGAGRWIDVSYSTDDGSRWTQRLHVLANGFVVTAQAAEGHEAPALGVAEQLVRAVGSA